MSDVNDLDVDDGFAFDMPSPQSLRQSIPSPLMNEIPSHDYNFSGIIYDESTDGAQSTEDEYFPHEDGYVNDETDDQSLRHITPSRHSSISSFPASVIHHAPTYNDRPHTPSKLQSSYTSPRAHSTGFRHPSSVRALQMRDEYEFTDADDLTPNRRRRDSRLSYISYRSSASAQSSPTKSFRTRSAQSSPLKPGKPKLKKEFPLVLLHCTLLPPSLFVRASVLSGEKEGKESVLEAIIPEPYAKRWKALQDKIVRNPEVRTRGVLIPHPREDYDLLEERLLESLELEKPRIRLGHYIGPEERASSAVDSGFESADSSCNEDGPAERHTHGERCPDCGHDFRTTVEQDKQWDIKVFAANGLMKSGAWDAAWPEMEKVDVEVSIWMPEDIRREVDNRLEALIDKEREEKQERQKMIKRRRRGIDDQRAREIYGEPVKTEEVEARSQEQIDGLVDDVGSAPTIAAQQSPSRLDNGCNAKEQLLDDQQTSQPERRVDLVSAFARYLQLVAQDRRNVAIILLIVLVFINFPSGPSRKPLTDNVLNTDKMVSQESLSAGPSTLVITETSTSLTISTSTVVSIVTSIAATTAANADGNTHTSPASVDDVFLLHEQSSEPVHDNESVVKEFDWDDSETISKRVPEEEMFIQVVPFAGRLVNGSEPVKSQGCDDSTTIIAPNLSAGTDHAYTDIELEQPSHNASDDHVDLELTSASQADKGSVDSENDRSTTQVPEQALEGMEDGATHEDLYVVND